MTLPNFKRIENVRVEHIPGFPLRESGIEEQLTSMSSNYGIESPVLLAFSDAGVTWGKLDNGKWKTSADIIPDHSPRLTFEGIIECRVFSPAGEIYLWREGDQLSGRVLVDTGGDAIYDYVDRKFILWGTRTCADESRDGFTVVDESQGMKHAVPVDIGQFPKNSSARPLRLVRRVYLDYNEDTGAVYEKYIRLLSLFVMEGEV